MTFPFVSAKEKWQLHCSQKYTATCIVNNNHQRTTRSHWMLEIYRMDWAPIQQTVASTILRWLWSHFLHSLILKINGTYKTFCFGITLQYRDLLFEPLLLTVLWCSLIIYPKMRVNVLTKLQLPLSNMDYYYISPKNLVYLRYVTLWTCCVNSAVLLSLQSHAPYPVVISYKGPQITELQS
jgi:hypothetical protein